MVAWLFVFALSFDDFLITFMTKGPGADTLPIKIFSQMRFGVQPQTECALRPTVFGDAGRRARGQSSAAAAASGMIEMSHPLPMNTTRRKFLQLSRGGMFRRGAVAGCTRTGRNAEGF